MPDFIYILTNGYPIEFGSQKTSSIFDLLNLSCY